MVVFFIVKIHLPLKQYGYVRVFVTPSKTYGKFTGLQLIKKYGKLSRKPKIQPNPIKIIDNDLLLSLTSRELPQRIIIKDRVFKTREIINSIESVIHQRIISKREDRALKHCQNTSIKIPLECLQDKYVF